MSLTETELAIPGHSGWRLRAWRQTDAADLARVAGDPAVWRWMSDHFPHPYTLDVARHWVSTGHVAFGGENVAVECDGTVQGGAGLRQGDGPARCNVEIGYYLAPAFWGRGVGTSVVAALVQRAWSWPEVTRIFAPIHAGNGASAAVLRRNGFVCEGRQRLAAFKAGRVIDLETWALYREPQGDRPAIGASPV